MLTSMTVRVRAGVAVLLALFVALVVVQLVVSDQLQVTEQRHAERLGEARAVNQAILQHMTDAETGVRGFQLTGDTIFLAPYESGRRAAFTEFERLATLVRDDDARRWLTAQRSAAAHWLTAYATPIVNARVAERDDSRAARGRASFDRIRAANAAVDDALRAERVAVAAADRERTRTVQFTFAGLAVALVALAMTMTAVHQRHLLAPLEHIRRTLQRLAAGDRSARAVPTGTGELRAVIGTLNLLAAETERLLADEHARAVRTELRQQVAAELRRHRDEQTAALRVAEMLADAFDADVVHARVAIEAGAGVNVRHPLGAAVLPADTVATILAFRPGEAREVPDTTGGIAVTLPGDADCPPGLLYLARRRRPRWTDEERRQLSALAREIEHVVRQRRLHVRQARLITELRTLDERKDAFVATVTHELRTPLTSILGYTEMLTDDDADLNPAQRRGLAAILRNALRLRDTVADLLLLDPGAHRAGGPAVPVDLSQVTATVAADLAGTARTKGLTITVDAAPAWVNGDAARLERAVRNLLDNALKFTPPGGAITCRISPGPGSATLEITDTGIGVPSDDLPGLFTPFHRGANAMAQAVQGSGLGLAIVLNIVTEHGGAVAVRSALGQGSTFTVTLPLLVAPPLPEPALLAD